MRPSTLFRFLPRLDTGSIHVVARSAVTGVVAGAVALGTAWAGAGLTSPPPPAPSPERVDEAVVDTVAERDPSATADRALQDADVDAALAADEPVLPPSHRLGGGLYWAGGASASIAPDDSTWIRHGSEGDCGTPEAYTPLAKEGCLLTFDRRWATQVDEMDIKVRAIAIGNGEKTVVTAVLDTVGWFRAYPADVCGDCGAEAIAKTIADRTGGKVEPQGVMLTSSHTHAAPDTLSTTPTWYYEQVRDTILATMLTAVSRMQPAVLETGSIPAKGYNVDRRIVTRAVPDYELGWLRAVSAGGDRNDGRTIATIVNFAVHPTVRTNNAELHGGFVGPLTETLEKQLGGTALWLPGGLGDQTVDRGWGTDGIGIGLAELVIEGLPTSYRLQSNDMAIDQAIVKIPGENTFMLAASGAGLFVRDNSAPYAEPGGPAMTQRGGARTPSCQTVAELFVNSPVGGFRFGRAGEADPEEKNGQHPDRGDSVVLMQAPGEIFSSIALTTKDYLAKSRNVLIAGMTNDTVGYLIPYEQYDERAAQGAGIANNSTDLANYEEALSLGRCAGDTVQNALLESGQRLGVMGSGEGP